MFATRETPSDQDRRNLATGETSIDIKSRIADPIASAHIGRLLASLLLLDHLDDLLVS